MNIGLVPFNLQQVVAIFIEQNFGQRTIRINLVAGDQLQLQKILLQLSLVIFQHAVKIEPEAIATESTEWLKHAWFDSHNGSGLPDLVAPAWGYAKPANVFEQLDRWGDQLAGISAHPALNIPFDPRQDRVNHPVLATWLYQFD